MINGFLLSRGQERLKKTRPDGISENLSDRQTSVSLQSDFSACSFAVPSYARSALGETHRKSYAFDIDLAVSRYKSSDRMHDLPWSFLHAVNRLLHRGYIYMSTK